MISNKILQTINYNEMMIQLEVEVAIRKGLGPDFITKHFPVGFDDLPEETTDLEINEMARMEVNEMLYKSDDYRHYGKNWEIVNIQYS